MLQAFNVFYMRMNLVYYWKMWVGDNFLRGLNPSSPPAMKWPSHILAWLLSEKEKLTNRETFVVTAIRYYEMGLVVEWVMRRRHDFCVFKRQITAALMKSANSKWGQSWKILFSYFEFWLLCYSRWSARCQGWDDEIDVLSWMCTMRQWEILDVLLQLKLWCSRFETISDLQR